VQQGGAADQIEEEVAEAEVQAHAAAAVAGGPELQPGPGAERQRPCGHLVPDPLHGPPGGGGAGAGQVGDPDLNRPVLSDPLQHEVTGDGDERVQVPLQDRVQRTLVAVQVKPGRFPLHVKVRAGGVFHAVARPHQ
jgi:hypothetical protein